jgi:5-(carboxyamino)imidazole ribonucleotide mutase
MASTAGVTLRSERCRRQGSDTGDMVGILMGSDSDLKVMQGCVDQLDEFGIPYELTVASAHRTPERASAYAQSAQGRGLKVIIAAAGWAAHLPGVIASYTTLPVIGVPISSSPLGGLDALYSIVQMPPGIPVATVGVDTARNAAILAAQILAVGDPALTDKLILHRARMAEQVIAKAEQAQRSTLP